MDIMTVEALRKRLSRLKNLCEDARKDEKDFSSVRNPTRELFDFRARKAGYHRDLLSKEIFEISHNLSYLKDYEKSYSCDVTRILELIVRLEERNPIVTMDICDELLEITKSLSSIPKSYTGILNISMPQKIPKEIYDEVRADIDEIQKCFNAGCFRSAAILCGRILETALHRKYFDVTGNDALEKSPGIGLGKLVAKLAEKNIEFDPGMTQQIHLINQTRIFTVHKQQTPFYPSKEQTHAI